MDDYFLKLTAPPSSNNENIRLTKDQRIIIKRIPKFKLTDNIFKKMHPQREFDFALKLQDAQYQLELCNKQNAENVVSIYSAIELENYYYIFMERCENSLLQEMNKYISIIKQGNQQQIIDILYQIFKGYKFLQSITKDFIHRDLALDNLLYKIEDGRIIVKIADFGISKTDEMIQTSNINQKQKYLAPEFRDFTYKKKEQGKYTNQIDIYAIGICLYTMMFGLGDTITFVTDRGTLDIDNKEQNKLVKLIIDMTQQNSENRISWEDLQQRIIHDHVIFHSIQYYELLKQQQEQLVKYDKQTFLEFAMLLINYYKNMENGIEVYKPFIRDDKKYLEYFQTIDHFIDMIRHANENETYILLQVLELENQRDEQSLIQEMQKNNFKNLEFLQIKQYLRVILQRALEQLRSALTQQQQFQILQEIRRRSSNPQYYNHFINTKLKDVSEGTCCLIM
ncbi:hypothetical protein pb186bvf_008302 [Paramecium bursaria]